MAESERLTKMVSFRVSDAEHQQIQRLADADKRRVADMVRLIFRAGLRVVGRKK